MYILYTFGVQFCIIKPKKNIHQRTPVFFIGGSHRPQLGGDCEERFPGEGPVEAAETALLEQANSGGYQDPWPWKS
jgi:hypothetical protein